MEKVLTLHWRTGKDAGKTVLVRAAFVIWATDVPGGCDIKTIDGAQLDVQESAHHVMTAVPV